jgi:hypothetical protein
MPVRRSSVVLFFLAAVVPFAGCLIWFVLSAQSSLLTPPAAYIEMLRRGGSATYMISLQTWKHVLARDPLCRAADVIVIGSSRVREIDHTVSGRPTCNLYVDGLAAGGFARLARALPTATSGHQIVYVGLDHFWLWSHDRGRSEDLEIAFADRSTTLWQAWTVARTLGFFQWRDVVEVARRERDGTPSFENQHSVWYPDGHLYHPLYYTEKKAGRHPVFTRAEVEEAAAAIYAGNRLHADDLRLIADSVRLIHGKGYAVRIYWNPVSPAHLVVAQRFFPDEFRAPLDAINRLAATLPLDRYVEPGETMNPARFGCADNDYFDTTHVDVDCIRRVFAGVFGNVPPAASALE